MKSIKIWKHAWKHPIFPHPIFYRWEKKYMDLGPHSTSLLDRLYQFEDWLDEGIKTCMKAWKPEIMPVIFVASYWNY